MATANGAFVTYEQVGKVEDVSDIITNISPTKTPFQTGIGSENISNILHQWQEDSLAAVGVNAALEGADASDTAVTPTVPRANVAQILTKTAHVSGTADRVKTYGRAKELAYQLTLRSAELKRDLENAMVGVTTGANLGNDTTARKMASYSALVAASSTYNIDTASTDQGFGTGGPVNTSVGSIAVGSNAAGVPLTGGAAGPLTEQAVLAVANELYTAGAEPDTLMVLPHDSLVVAAWQAQTAAVARTMFVDNGDRSITNVVDFYQSPFGRLAVTMNRFIAPNVAMIYEKAMWRKLVLRNWFRQTLAIAGDSTRVQIVGEFSLKHRNAQASGMITNVKQS